MIQQSIVRRHMACYGHACEAEHRSAADGMPDGSPLQSQETYLSIQLDRYHDDSNYPGPPTLNDKARPVRALSHLEIHPGNLIR